MSLEDIAFEASFPPPSRVRLHHGNVCNDLMSAWRQRDESLLGSLDRLQCVTTVSRRSRQKAGPALSSPCVFPAFQQCAMHLLGMREWLSCHDIWQGSGTRMRSVAPELVVVWTECVQHAVVPKEPLYIRADVSTAFRVGDIVGWSAPTVAYTERYLREVTGGAQPAAKAKKAKKSRKKEKADKKAKKKKKKTGDSDDDDEDAASASEDLSSDPSASADADQPPAARYAACPVEGGEYTRIVHPAAPGNPPRLRGVQLHPGFFVLGPFNMFEVTSDPNPALRNLGPPAAKPAAGASRAPGAPALFSDSTAEFSDDEDYPPLGPGGPPSGLCLIPKGCVVSDEAKFGSFLTEVDLEVATAEPEAFPFLAGGPAVSDEEARLAELRRREGAAGAVPSSAFPTLATVRVSEATQRANLERGIDVRMFRLYARLGGHLNWMTGTASIDKNERNGRRRLAREAEIVLCETYNRACWERREAMKRAALAEALVTLSRATAEAARCRLTRRDGGRRVDLVSGHPESMQNVRQRWVQEGYCSPHGTRPHPAHVRRHRESPAQAADRLLRTAELLYQNRLRLPDDLPPVRQLFASP
ncbi:hypothetical protein DIPPA_14002 [Diplonema papillatum]|nr:hypothetical protein DIPPA_14002 [Diplonema papillatum]|eukprot:gene20412-31416_t